MKILPDEKETGKNELHELLNDIYSRCNELHSFGFPKHRMIFGGKYTKLYGYYDDEDEEIVINYFFWKKSSLFRKRLLLIHEILHYLGIDHDQDFCYEEVIFDYFSFRFYLKIFRGDGVLEGIDEKLDKKIGAMLSEKRGNTPDRG